jgi:hypothetical protein
MQKELNPALFGENSSPSRVYEANQHSQVNYLDQKVLETRTQLRHFGEQFQKVVSQMNEFIKSTNGKFDKVQQQIHRLEQNDQAIVKDAGQRISAIHQRFSDKNNMEYKVQEMMEKHQAILRGYELKLQQAQKMLNEKESQLVSTQALLSEAKMELARLKRI